MQPCDYNFLLISMDHDCNCEQAMFTFLDGPCYAATEKMVQWQLHASSVALLGTRPKQMCWCSLSVDQRDLVHVLSDSKSG